VPVVIGLTGNTGVGKTTVANKLRSLGCEVADGDVIAKTVLVEDSEPLRRDHPNWFVDGQPSFRRIAEEVFAGRDLYDAYCRYLWPRVRARVQEMIQTSQAEFLVYDASMLFEAGSDVVCDLTVLVTADDAVRKERALARSGWSSEQYDRRQGFQWPQEEKACRATLRLHNKDGVDELEAKAESLLKQLVPRMLQGGSKLASLEDAWLFANRWWLADSLDQLSAFYEVAAVMKARGGYHSLSHIERMLAKYRQYCEVTGERPDPRLISWIFAHDLVYQPGAPDNEAESVIKMDRLLETMSAYRRIEPDDRTAIKSTKTHLPVDPSCLDEPSLVDSIHLLHDLDLEILGSGRKVYEEYSGAVYAEYLDSSDDPADFPRLWSLGRAAFLEAMLNRKQIFKTAYFADLESQALENMRTELARVLGGGSGRSTT